MEECSKEWKLEKKVIDTLKNSGLAPIDCLECVARLFCSFSITLGLAPHKEELIQLISDMFDDYEERINIVPEFKKLMDTLKKQ